MRRFRIVWIAVVCGWCGSNSTWGQNHPELEWHVLVTEHFRVLYYEGLEALAQRAAGLAEAAWEPVTELYDFRPDGPVRLILKDYDDYANGAAYFYHDAIEIWTSPLEHDFELRGTSDWLRNVITHEFVHIISLGASRKGSQRVPAMFLEYFAYKEEKNRDDILTGASKTHMIQKLDGSGTRQAIPWVIQGREGASVEIRVRAEKGGSDTVTVTLR